MKEQKDKILNKVKKGINFVSDTVSNQIGEIVKEQVDENLKEIESRITKIEKIIFISLFGSLLISISIIFLTIGLFYLLLEYYEFKKYTAFLIIGLILLLIGIVIKMNERRLSNNG